MLAALHLFTLHLFVEIISEPFHKSQQQSNYILKPTLQQLHQVRQATLRSVHGRKNTALEAEHNFDLISICEIWHIIYQYHKSLTILAMARTINTIIPSAWCLLSLSLCFWICIHRASSVFGCHVFSPHFQATPVESRLIFY